MDYPDPTKANMESWYPDWTFGSTLPGGIVFARRQGSPLLKGEDYTELRDKINGWLSQNDEPVPNRQGEDQTAG